MTFPNFPAPTRRSLLIGGGAAVSSALLVGCGFGRDKTTAGLRVAVIGKGATDARLLFPAAGLVPDFGISYSEFDSGHLAVEALNSGAIDIVGISEIPPVFALASAVQSFVQVAVLHGDVNSQVILVPKVSAIHSLADLKGKRIGYVRATTSQYYLIQMLKSVGLGWSDIDPVAMTVADGAAAFAQGSLDAWAIYGYPIERAVATQGAKILKTALGFLSGNYLVAAHKDAVADPVRHDLIGRFMRLQRKGYAWSTANPAQWAPIVAKAIGVPAEYVSAQINRQSDPYQLRPVNDAAIQSQQGVADVFAGAGLIPHKVDVRPLWDTSFNSVIEEA